MAKSLGLYVHIPFCKSKCIYCDFYSLPRNEEKMDAYLSALTVQIVDAAPQAQDYCVDTVYFGGGTPSYFGSDRLCRVLDTICKHYAVAADAEITFEANPDSARDGNALKSLRAAGFNRISLGMQSGCDEELRLIGRIHTSDETKAAVDAARAAGFNNLSLDLIYGLPEQSKELWLDNLAAAAALSPEHLSCYGLKIEEGTPLFVQRKHFAIPDDETQSDEYLACVEFLKAHGYAQYEISNFSKAGFESRHNLKYWTLAPYLGFGPGAHSDFDGRRFAVERDLDRYLKGEITYSENSPISSDERTQEYLMLGLRTVRGISEKEYGRPFSKIEAVLRQCEASGLAEKSGERWHLTPQGFLVSNAVIVRVLGAAE